MTIKVTEMKDRLIQFALGLVLVCTLAFGGAVLTGCDPEESTSPDSSTEGSQTVEDNTDEGGGIELETSATVTVDIPDEEEQSAE